MLFSVSPGSISPLRVRNKRVSAEFAIFEIFMTWRFDAVFGFSRVDFPPTGSYLKSFVKIRDVGKIAFWHPGRTYVRTHHHVFGHITMAAAPTALCRVLKLFIFVGNY